MLFTFIVAGLCISFILYFLPSINAWRRKHVNLPAIFCLNFFLGWTFLGWVAALVWSFLEEPDSPT